MRGENPCAEPKFNTCHYLPNTCQYIPIHTTIHASLLFARYIAHGFSPSIQVLACILVCTGMYCHVLCNDTSQYKQIYQCIPLCTIHTIFPVHTNTSEYVQIDAIHIIHTNAYQYRSVLSNTYQYRHIQTNTYKYLQYILLLTNTYKYRSVHTIHTSTYHTSNTDQHRSINYIQIHTNTYQYIPIHTNTGQYCPRIIHIITYQYLGRRFAAALLPRLFRTNPRSHHKGATGRVRTGAACL